MCLWNLLVQRSHFSNDLKAVPWHSKEAKEVQTFRDPLIGFLFLNSIEILSFFKHLLLFVVHTFCKWLIWCNMISPTWQQNSIHIGRAFLCSSSKSWEAVQSKLPLPITLCITIWHSFFETKKVFYFGPWVYLIGPLIALVRWSIRLSVGPSFLKYLISFFWNFAWSWGGQ